MGKRIAEHYEKCVNPHPTTGWYSVVLTYNILWIGAVFQKQWIRANSMPDRTAAVRDRARSAAEYRNDTPGSNRIFRYFSTRPGSYGRKKKAQGIPHAGADVEFVKAYPAGAPHCSGWTISQRLFPGNCLRIYVFPLSANTL
jgi:hypothetical protein